MLDSTFFEHREIRTIASPLDGSYEPLHFDVCLRGAEGPQQCRRNLMDCLLPLKIEALTQQVPEQSTV